MGAIDYVDTMTGELMSFTTMKRWHKGLRLPKSVLKEPDSRLTERVSDEPGSLFDPLTEDSDVDDEEPVLED